MAFTVTYVGNGSDGGAVPVDPASYAAGANVSLQPIGSLSKSGAVFAYWNTKADGSGAFHGWPVDTSFTMPSADVILYAQWFVTDGLPKGGATKYYTFAYDSALAASGLEPGRTTTLMNAADADFAIMQDWFPGVTPSGPSPIPVYTTALNGGANNTGTIRLKPNTTDPNELRSYLVSEITESFMNGQNRGWGFLPGINNEESCGEALSLFLTQQFELEQGIAGPYTAFPGNNWLNSSLPTSNSNSTRFYDKTSTSQGYDYGSRIDYVNSILPWFGNGPGTGCSILFIYYLYHQLGFTVNEIIAAAPGYTNGALNAVAPLRGVYKNLTGDDSDPFPFFSNLLASAFPPDQVSSVAGPQPDDPWPLAVFQYWRVKNTYGSDEVSDIIKVSGGVYPNAFSLSLEGFNRQVLGGALPSLPTIAFAGVTARPSATPPSVFQFDDPRLPQRVLYDYDIHFDSTTVAAFSASGETPAEGDASITVLGQAFYAKTEFFFVAGADPYFANVLPNRLDPTKDNVPWLSQDLRVFTATPGQPGGAIPVPSPGYVAPSSYPVPPGAPNFSESNSYGDYDIAGAYTYLTKLLAWLTTAYGDPSKADPFDVNNAILPGQTSAYTGDSSVTPGAKANGATYNNYNFAIARVRLRGSAGPSGAAPDVKVFFRLWQTQTADTDWNPGYTYLSDDPTGLNPQVALAPSDNHTVPFFATGNYPVTSDPPNDQTLTINQGDSQWAYFGCFLNLYDPSFGVNGQSIQQQFAQGTHHCLVAQIAYKNAPIRIVNGVGVTTESSDQLAQRNLQVTTSANPGNFATHRIPQTFDIKRSAPPPPGAGAFGHPDELMIDWGNTPPGCVVSLYWPGASAADVVAESGRLYGSQVLSAADAHTIQTVTRRGVTYVPIPGGAGESLAGLLTIDLPANVVKGQEFDIVIRRIGSLRVTIAPPPPPPPPPPRIAIARRPAANRAPQPRVAAAVSDVRIERYVVGSFQVKIPVKTKSDMLGPEETTLAIVKARLAAMPKSSRWYPVIERYLGLLIARVDGLGGEASEIGPSFAGYPAEQPGGDGHDPGRGHGHGCEDRWEEYTGKIAGIIFDHFGDFEGFVLDLPEGERRFASREREIRKLAVRAWAERLRVTVLADPRAPHRPLRFIMRGLPEAF